MFFEKQVLRRNCHKQTRRPYHIVHSRKVFKQKIDIELVDKVKKGEEIGFLFDDLECKAHIFSKRTYSTKAVSKACQTFHSRQKRLKKCHSRILKSFSRFTIIFVKAQEVGVFPLCAKSFL